MKHNEIQIGATYGVIRDGATVPVIVKEIKTYTPFCGRAVKRYICLNTITHRMITIKSAQRFRALNTSNCKHD